MKNAHLTEYGFTTVAYNFKVDKHRGVDVIWIEFPKDETLLQQLKSISKPRWSASQKCWYVNDVSAYRAAFGLPQKIVSQSAYLQIYPVNRPVFKKYIEHLKLKAYSANTLKTYTAEFAHFLATLKGHAADSLTAEKLRSYFLYCIETLKLSENYLHSRMNAVKFYYDQVLGREKLFIEIPRPKKPSLLPKAITLKDIKKMLAAVTNQKHLVLLKVCYGMGLRVSEVVELKIEDIDSMAMQVLIRRAKGKKDRYVNLPHSLLDDLRDYYKNYQPKKYLFEGQFGYKYSIRSAQAVFKHAMRMANINKPVGIHSLRHSYATHLLQSGTDISFIKELLGHNDIKTTLRYTKLANNTINNIKSPLDFL